MGLGAVSLDLIKGLVPSPSPLHIEGIGDTINNNDAWDTLTGGHEGRERERSWSDDLLSGCEPDTLLPAIRVPHAPELIRLTRGIHSTLNELQSELNRRGFQRRAGETISNRINGAHPGLVDEQIQSRSPSGMVGPSTREEEDRARAVWSSSIAIEMSKDRHSIELKMDN